MRPPDERGGGHRPRLRTGPAAKQLRRQFLASGKDTAQLDLEDYRDEMATAAQEAGMRGADFTSPDWIRRAVGYIYALEPGELATGDDLRRELGSAPSPGAPGVAIKQAQRFGLIEFDRYVKATSITRHGGVTGQWRRTTVDRHWTVEP